MGTVVERVLPSRVAGSSSTTVQYTQGGILENNRRMQYCMSGCESGSLNQEEDPVENKNVSDRPPERMVTLTASADARSFKPTNLKRDKRSCFVSFPSS